MATEFKSAKQTTNVEQNDPLSKLMAEAMMSPQGKKLAAKTAPKSGFSGQFVDGGQPAADEFMQGKRRGK